MNEELVYNQIKNKFIDIKINKRVSNYLDNQYDLSKYYEIGELVESVYKDKKYGNSLIKNYANKLTKELGKGYSWRNLYYCKLYYNLMISKSLPLSSTKLSWSHFRELLILHDYNEIIYYIDKCVSNNLSRDKLREIIKLKE